MTKDITGRGPFFATLSYMHFLAARAMPDGALAVAMALGESSVVVMRLYIDSMGVNSGYETIETGFAHGFNSRPYHRKTDTNVDMQFRAGSTVTMTRAEYDEATYFQRIPEYAGTEVAQTKALPPPGA